MVILVSALVLLGCNGTASEPSNPTTSSKAGVSERNVEQSGKQNRATSPRNSSNAGNAQADSNDDDSDDIALTEQKVKTSAADADATMSWLERIRDIQLDYHCKYKYGGRDQFDSDPRQIKSKWEALLGTIDNEGRQKVDPAVLRYYVVRAAFETLVMEKERDLEERVVWLAVRHVVEKKVGAQAKQVFDLLPDDSRAKQDLAKVINAMKQAGLQISKASEVLGLAYREMQAALQQHYPQRAEQLLATINSVYDPLVVGKFERTWLEKNKPDVLRRLQVQGLRAANEAKAILTLLEADKYQPDIDKHGGKHCRIYRQHADWAVKYEANKLGFLAVPIYRAIARSFPPALREAMRAKAATLNPQENLGLYAHTLQLSTFELLQPSGAGKKPHRVVVHPENSAVLEKLAKALKPGVGYLGEMLPREATVALALSSDGSTLVSISKALIETIDMKTGKVSDPIVLPDTGPALESVCISSAGDFVIVSDQRRQLHKFDIRRNAAADGFTLAPLPHNDPALAVSPDGKWIAASGSNNVQVIDATTGQLRNKFFAKGLVQALCFEQDSKTLVVGGQDRAVSGYDAFTGERKWSWPFGPPNGEYVTSLTRTPDGYLAVGGSDRFAVWKGKGESPIFDLPMPGGYYCRAAGLTADRRGAINEYGVFDMQSKKPLVAYAMESAPKKCIVHPDGKRLIVFSRTKIRVIPIILGEGDKW